MRKWVRPGIAILVYAQALACQGPAWTARRSDPLDAGNIPLDDADPRRRAGCWAYLAPMLSFLVLAETGRRAAEDWQPILLAARVVVPLGLLIWFWRRGEYPELKFRVTAMTIVDAVLGVALAALWMTPYVVVPGLRPVEEVAPFDPAMAGAALVPLVLTTRMIGYAFVTPLMEELFMRSFLIRFVEVLDEPEKDFREIGIGQFGWRSFAAVIVVFLATHVSWEWVVMFPWAIITTVWLYFRKDVFAVVVVHAATNASILLAAIFLSGTFPARPDQPEDVREKLSLWFFVECQNPPDPTRRVTSQPGSCHVPAGAEA